MKIFKRTNIIALSTGLLMVIQASSVPANPGDNKSGKNDKVTTSRDIAVAASGSTVDRKTGQSDLILKAEQWELSRSGDYVLSLTTVNNIVNAWLKDKRKTIEIQYPGGEEGEFWMQELFDWLVALGIPSASMVTSPGSGAVDVIRFGLIK